MILFLSACATGAKYEAYLDSLIGISKDDIMEGLGKPNEEYTANGKEFLTYKNNHGYSEYGTRIYCDTTYILKDGKMVSWKYKGNTCRM